MKLWVSTIVWTLVIPILITVNSLGVRTRSDHGALTWLARELCLLGEEMVQMFNNHVVEAYRCLM